MTIRDAKDITAAEYADGIFVIEDEDQTVTGVWWIPEGWKPGNRRTAYARWYIDRQTAEAAETTRTKAASLETTPDHKDPTL